MNKFFQHKFLVNSLAFIVFALAVANISLPAINKYNLNVEEEQIKLRIEANGFDDRKVSFSIYSLERGNTENLSTFILSTLFLSLIFTKRVILSLLFAFLLFVEFIVIFKLRINAYFITSYYFDFLFFVFWLMSSLGLAVSICYLARKGFQIKDTKTVS